MSGRLSRIKQIAAKTEATPGTFDSSVYAAANAQHLISEATFGYEPVILADDTLHDSLSKRPGTVTRKIGKLGFSIKLAGHSSGGTPPWEKFLPACGYRSVATNKITIGAVTDGPFRHGELISQALSLATARVAHDTYDGTTTIYVYDVIGTPNGTGVWTGGSSGATATPSTVETAAGITWFPVSSPQVRFAYAGTPTTPTVGDLVTGNVTGAKGVVLEVDATEKVMRLRYVTTTLFAATDTDPDISGTGSGTLGAISAIENDNHRTLSLASYEDGVRSALGGARGSFTLAAAVSEPAKLNFEFLGITEDPADSPLLQGVSYPLKTAPLFVSASALVATEGSASTFVPRFSRLELQSGSTPVVRADANAANGIQEFAITDRNPTGSLDPELDLESSYPVLANFLAQTPSRLRATIGTAAANKFLCTVPGAVYTGAASGDRDGFAIRNWAFACTGNRFVPTAGPSSGETIYGSDNEVVITYITA